MACRYCCLSVGLMCNVVCSLLLSLYTTVSRKGTFSVEVSVVNLSQGRKIV